MTAIYAALLSMTLLIPCPQTGRAAAFVMDSCRRDYAAGTRMETGITEKQEFRMTLAEEDIDGEDDPAVSDAGIDIQYLLFLQEFRTSIDDAWTPFMEFASSFAVDYLILFALFIYWVIDKRKGLYVIGSMCLTLAVNQLIKLTACVYRPWIRDSRIVPAGNAIETATGYSFPSGHTATAAPQLGGHAANEGKEHPWISVLCILCLMVITFSRNYLGVHTPQDVLVATLESIVCLIVMWKIFGYLSLHPEKEDWFLLAGVIFGIVSIAYITYKPYPMTYVNGKLLVDPQKMMNDGYGDIAFLIAFCTGRFIEKKWIRFRPMGFSLIGMILTISGMVLYVFLHKNIRTPLDQLLGSHWGHFTWRMITVLFYMAGYPLIIRFFTGNSDSGQASETDN